jgi:hypothetical protein
MNEAQQLELFASQHHEISPCPADESRRKQIMNGHYMFYLCSATL